MEGINIRQATADDLPAILGLVKELAAYEREPDAVTATIETYRKSFEQGHFEALVAEYEGRVAGMTLYYTRYSTWRGPILYLEDFVVTENLRGKGIGKVLFEEYIEEGRRRGYAMCIWHVLDWNKPAINFYDKYEVIYDNTWVTVKYPLTD